MAQVDSGRNKTTNVRQICFALFAAGFGLLLGAGIGMSGVINIYAAVHCLGLAALFLIGMFWTWEHFSKVKPRWRYILGCAVSQVILIGLLYCVKFILISDAARVTKESNQRTQLLEAIEGGSGYCLFDAYQDEGSWHLHTFCVDQHDARLKEIQARFYLVKSLDGQPLDIWQRLNESKSKIGMFKIYFDSAPTGGSSFDYSYPVKSGLYMIDIATSKNRVTEKLSLSPNGREDYEVYQKDGKTLLRASCSPECGWCSQVCRQ